MGISALFFDQIPRNSVLKGRMARAAAFHRRTAPMDGFVLASWLHIGSVFRSSKSSKKKNSLSTQAVLWCWTTLLGPKFMTGSTPTNQPCWLQCIWIYNFFAFRMCWKVRRTHNVTMQKSPKPALPYSLQCESYWIMTHTGDDQSSMAPTVLQLTFGTETYGTL